MNLSMHFTLEEMIRSATAKRMNIPNTPNSQQIENLRMLCNNVLEPIRSTVGLPLHIDDGYRCPALNEAVGGVSDSQHMEGKAADFVAIGGTTPEEIFDMICRSSLEYDQAILEFDEWIHISYDAGHNRREREIATKDSNGKTVYQVLK